MRDLITDELLTGPWAAKKTYLITGVAGFIGSHVAQALRKRGDRVVGIDNLNDYYAPARKRANLAELAEAIPTSEFVFRLADIRDRGFLDGLFAECRFDAVIHLAGMAGVRTSVETPQEYCDVNIIGTLNLLEAVRRHKTGNFVFASTSSVYGASAPIPFVETDACDRPLSPYAASKRAGEILGFTYHHLHGVNFTALRFFTVYGPRGRPDMLAYKVLDNLCVGRAVPLYNNGQMRRDWTYVGDIVNGVIAAADRPLGYEVLNLGRGAPVLLADFVSTIEDCVGKKANLVAAPAPDSDVPCTHADISKAKALLGYTPATSIANGVRAMWQWYQRAVLRRSEAA